MNMEKFDALKFIEEYLAVLGVNQNTLKENVAKIFYTVALNTVREQSLDDDQMNALAQAEQFVKEGQRDQGIALLGTIFKNTDDAKWKEDFAKNLAISLSDLTDAMANTLTEEAKQKLAELIANLGAR